MNNFFRSIRNGILLSLASFMTAAYVDAATNGINVDPAPGSVPELSEFHLTFEGDWGLGTHRNAKFTVTGPEGVSIPPVYSYSLGADGGYMVYFADDATVSTPGEYTLTIPQGKFAINYQDLPETTFVYTVTGETPPTVDFPQYAITPEEGTYEALSDGFRILFDTEDEITINPELVYLDGPDGPISVMVEVPANMPYINIFPINAENQLITLDTRGTYTIIITAEAITAGNTKNPDPLVFNYIVSGSSSEYWQGDFSADPADGSEVESLKNITITFDGATTVKVSDTAAPSQFPALYNTDTNTLICRATAFASGNELQISLQQEVSDGGNYALVINPAFITVDGFQPTTEIKITYSINKSQTTFDFSYTLSPADGANLGFNEEVSITFSGEGLASVENNAFAWGNTAPHFTNDMGAFNPGIQIYNDGFTYYLSHQWPFEVEGTYHLVIPAGYFTLTHDNGTSVKNDVIDVTYNVASGSGIEGVEISPVDTTFPIYNVMGVRIDSTNTNSLPAGIYIINGRKILK